MNKRIIFVIFSFFAAMMFAPVDIFAAFDKEYILSDAELNDAQSMTQADIQAFLEDQGSSLAYMRLPDKYGVLRAPAEIIARAATEHGTNPKVLLVKLQKEQSLITGSTPTQKRLDWAMGYAVCDSCKTTDPRIQKYKGFGKQVDQAAEVMQWYSAQAPLVDWIKSPGEAITIDGETIYPKTQATFNFYLYTPHFHGNKNFVTLYERWFGQLYPNGTLLKSPHDPTVYVLDEGSKRPIATYTALVTRYNPNAIITVPRETLQNYPTGAPISFPNYSLLHTADTNKYFLVDYDVIRPFATADTVRQLGYHPDEIITIASTDIASYKRGTAIQSTSHIYGNLYENTDGDLFFVYQDEAFPIATRELATLRFPTLAIKQDNSGILKKIPVSTPLTLRDGTLVRVANSFYVIEHGASRAFASMQDVQSLGYTPSTATSISLATLRAHQAGEPMTTRVSARARTQSSIFYTKDIDISEEEAAEVPVASTQARASRGTLLRRQPVTSSSHSETTVPTDRAARLAAFRAARATRAAQSTAEETQQPTEITQKTTNGLIRGSIARRAVVADNTTSIADPTQETGVLYKHGGRDVYAGMILPTDIEAFVVMDAQDGTIYASKNKDVIRPLASLTKVAGAAAMRNLGLNLSARVTYHAAQHKSMYHRFSIVDGEQILADDLFDAMLISSMNTPPRMLASTLSGGITAVVSEMNQIAHTQQLRDTAFADPAGVTLGNLSTAAEYAKLYTYITDTDQEIRTRLAQTGYEYTELVDLNDHPNHWDNHTNKLLKRTDLPFEILHSKTGYLYEAGTCLAMRIKRPSDGKEFIIVTLGNPDVGTYTRFDEPVRLATRVLAGR